MQTRSGRLTYTLSGAGPASIVLFNGAGVSLGGWRGLYPDIERHGRVLAWNRFGVQGSDPPRQRQAGAVVIASLRELLGYAGLTPPYVLVAHSLGGLYANLFARLHPGETAGVLLLDATHPADRAVLRQHETQFVRALGKVLALPHLFFRRNVRSELESVDDTAGEIAAAGAFPEIPLCVITGGRTPPGSMLSPAAVGARRAHQQELARLSPHGRHVIAQESGHFPQLTQPELVLHELAELVAQCDAMPARRRHQLS